MKKVVTLLAALLLVTSFSTTAYAETYVKTYAESDAADVWCETSVGEDDLSVSVETNGQATDGLITISYDSSIVDCTEEDVVVADAVDMYSVNVVDDSVRISFLAEDAIATGTIAEIVFEVVDKDADLETLLSAISFSGEAFDENGEAVVVKPTEADEEEPENPGEENPPTNPGGQQPKPPVNSGGNGQQTGLVGGVGAGQVKTGDTTQISTYVILLLLTGALLLAFAVKRVMGNIGRRPNH